MPVINLIELGKIILKLLLIGALTAIVVSYAGTFTHTIGQLLTKMSTSGSTVNNLNLGWFASSIGLVDFLNALMQSLYVAGSFLVSGVIVVLSFKHGIKLFGFLLRV